MTAERESTAPGTPSSCAGAREAAGLSRRAGQRRRPASGRPLVARPRGRPTSTPAAAPVYARGHVAQHRAAPSAIDPAPLLADVRRGRPAPTPDAAVAQPVAVRPRHAPPRPARSCRTAPPSAAAPTGRAAAAAALGVLRRCCSASAVLDGDTDGRRPTTGAGSPPAPAAPSPRPRPQAATPPPRRPPPDRRGAARCGVTGGSSWISVSNGRRDRCFEGGRRRPAPQDVPRRRAAPGCVVGNAGGGHRRSCSRAGPAGPPGGGRARSAACTCSPAGGVAPAAPP